MLSPWTWGLVAIAIVTLACSWNVPRAWRWIGLGGLSFFAGIGERIREGHEMYETLKGRDLLKNTCMFFGQMDQNPIQRALIAQSAVTLGEYFRDEQGKDILFFADNMYRYIQAKNEVSTILGQVPSEGGYEPTIFSDVKTLQDRLASAAVQAALRGGDLEAAGRALAEDWPRLEQAQVHPASLSAHYQGLPDSGFGPLSVMEAALAGDAPVTAVVRAGDVPRVAIAAPAMVDGEVAGVDSSADATGAAGVAAGAAVSVFGLVYISAR